MHYMMWTFLVTLREAGYHPDDLYRAGHWTQAGVLLAHKMGMHPRTIAEDVIFRSKG